MGNKKGLLKSILPWLIVLMVISVAIPFFNQSESSEIRYDKFIEIVQKEKVKDEKSYFDTFDDSCFCRDVVFLL